MNRLNDDDINEAFCATGWQHFHGTARTNGGGTFDFGIPSTSQPQGPFTAVAHSPLQAQANRL